MLWNEGSIRSVLPWKVFWRHRRLPLLLFRWYEQSVGWRLGCLWTIRYSSGTTDTFIERVHESFPAGSSKHIQILKNLYKPALFQNRTASFTILLPLRDNKAVGPPVFSPTTLFYSNATTVNPVLKIETTWIYQSHATDGSLDGQHEPPPRCFYLGWSNTGWADVKIVDWYCDSVSRPGLYSPASYDILCEFSSKTLQLCT